MSKISDIGIGVTRDVSVVDRKIFETPVIVRSDLTRFEQVILNLLSHRQGEIVSKSDIAKALYTDETVARSNTIEVFVRRLRKKIGEDRITTRRGRGYVLNREDMINIDVA